MLKPWPLPTLLLTLVFIGAIPRHLLAEPRDQDIAWVEQAHIRVAMVASYTQLAPGQEFMLGIILAPDEDWHVYWRNPGDTGLAPSFAWEKSTGASLGEVGWPVPEAIPVAHLVNYGYSDQTTLLVPAQVTGVQGTQVDIDLKLNWLVCKEECIPGRAQLALALPIASQSRASAQHDLIAQQQAALPQTVTTLMSKAQVRDATFIAEIYFSAVLFKPGDKVEVFPLTRDLVSYNSPVELRARKNVLTWNQALSEYYANQHTHSEWLVVVNGKRGSRVSVPIALN